MRRKFVIISTVLTLILLLLVGCDSISSNPSTNNDLNGNFKIPELEERTNWNIELSFIECTDTGIKIKICDHDNQGFSFNDLYFVLEIYENGEWVKISKMNENAASQNLGYVFPSESENYVDLDSMNRFAFLPDVELKTGHYRLTKILSGREFSLEFDLNFD